MKNISLLILLILVKTGSFAQTDLKQEAIGEFKKLSDLYRNARFLSFDVLYRRSTEERPGVYLDSLSGNFKLNGSSFWFSLDETETLFNGEFVVVVYKEDNVIYLSKPSANIMGGNPLALLDSLFNMPGLTYSVSQEGKKRIMSVNFPPNGRYKQIKYETDKKSGLVSRIVQVVKESELYDPEIKDALAQDHKYGIIETIFSEYSHKRANPASFDAGRYFRKEGSEYVAVAPYQSYKVFLGSPNL